MTLENYLMDRVTWSQEFNEIATSELHQEYDYESEEWLLKEVLQHEY